MSLSIEKADFFFADYYRIVGYYVEKGGEELGYRFEEAVDLALRRLSSRPDLGGIRHFRHATLQGLRSFQVNTPFNAALIFYHADATVLHAVRLIHGARNLPRRLQEPPGA